MRFWRRSRKPNPDQRYLYERIYYDPVIHSAPVLHPPPHSGAFTLLLERVGRVEKGVLFRVVTSDPTVRVGSYMERDGKVYKVLTRRAEHPDDWFLEPEFTIGLGRESRRQERWSRKVEWLEDPLFPGVTGAGAT